MKIGILAESASDNRVSLLPEGVHKLKTKGLEIVFEPGAGIRAFATDQAYIDAGAVPLPRTDLIREADLLLSIHLPSDVASFPAGKWLCGMFQPLYIPSKIEELAKQGLNIFSLDMLPRTSRAQGMDVLSAQANIAGYRAVILAAGLYPRYFPMFITAAGSVPPVKVLVLGAGVAGLQAIATARRLGAVVEVFDTRPAVKEEVMSLGAKFIEVEGAKDSVAAGGYAIEQTDVFKQKQQESIAVSIARADVVITTAQIPGKKAPLLVTEEMVRKMKAGSVIVDLAAANGGNTEVTENGKTKQAHMVTIAGYSDLPSQMPSDASRLYGNCIVNFLSLFSTKDGGYSISLTDQLAAAACLCMNGELRITQAGPAK